MISDRSANRGIVGYMHFARCRVGKVSANKRAVAQLQFIDGGVQVAADSATEQERADGGTHVTADLTIQRGSLGSHTNVSINHGVTLQDSGLGNNAGIMVDLS